LDEREEVRGVLTHCGERSVASEGIEGVSKVHLDSDALRIDKHACKESVVNAATASWDAHGHLEGVQLYPGPPRLDAFMISSTPSFYFLINVNA
jgi:hypothetical protein